MFDTRSEYRMISSDSRSYGGRLYYNLEYRPWWALSWRFVGCELDEEAGRRRAEDHATPRHIIALGRFPKREGEKP